MAQRKLAVLALGVIMTAAVSITGVHPVSAAPNIQSQLNQVHSEQQQKQHKLNQVKEKEAKVLQQVKKLQGQISDTEKKISKVKADQKKTQQKIIDLKKRIIKTEKRIKRRDQLLKDRVRLMYKNGSTVHFIQVVLGSQDFSDFLDRVFALHLIAKQDKDLLDAQKADKKQEEKEKAQIVKSLKQLQNQLDSLQGLKADLHSKTKKAQDLLDQLKGKGSQIKQAIQADRDKINSLTDKQQAKQASARESHSSGSNTSDVSYSAPSTSGGSASGSVQDMIQAGRQWIGNSIYVFGGGRTSYQIQHGIFDCSSFVHWEFQQIGVNVGWSTSQLSHEGHAVSPSQMKPGDLVFFDTYKTNGHVGIYIGGGKFINCETSDGVAIVSLSNPYWSAHFHGHVRRVL